MGTDLRARRRCWLCGLVRTDTTFIDGVGFECPDCSTALSRQPTKAEQRVADAYDRRQAARRGEDG